MNEIKTAASVTIHNLITGVEVAFAIVALILVVRYLATRMQRARRA